MARRQIDPDAELDATACVRKMLQNDPDSPSQPPQGFIPAEPAPRRSRRTQGRSYGPDTIPGLCDYFTRACPPMSWAGGLEVGNRRALAAIFSELRRDAGLTPDDCRALVDLYITALGDKRPNRPYVWDFKWRRFTLLGHLRDTGRTVTTEEYRTWTEQPADTTTAEDTFAASWGNA
jgi:hypothetical protein